MAIEIVEADTEDLRQLALALRHAVFVVEQGVPEDLESDGLDAAAFHAIAVDDGRCIATGRLVRQPGGVARLGRMAVHASWRRRGLGGRVLAALEARARAEGLREAQLHAQCYVEEFYRRRGYVRVGEVFEEAGIDHVAMRKRL
jgi:predicted GNAT family N-acyltransferase